MGNPAVPYLYVYLVGGAIFAAGMVLAWRQGFVGSSGRALRNLCVCIFVLVFFASIQGYLQFAPMRSAPAVAYQGEAARQVTGSGTRGSTIDYVIMFGYFLAILAVGSWYARRQKTAKDFFFGGQRFSWWLIAFSLIATTVGSYSFVKYSNKGFGYGLSSSQTYLNDWIWFPLLIFGWLPILYFSRVTSIPEYFGRRFDRTIRLWATVFVLIYLVGYVGVNLFTMGKVLNALVGWEIPVAALLVAVVSCTYVTAGGQTSVIMTDLLQGVMLLFTGLLILGLGIYHVGGFEAFWTHLPRSSRLAFPNFNQDTSFPSVGIFWQDAVANSAMFYFLNQGIIMRFLAAKSLAESRKAAVALMVILMTVAACVVGGGGWVARVLVQTGHLPADLKASDAFYEATELLSHPGVFGLILAALTAALMSTVDTLITAVAAVVVNDLYKPYIRPDAGERDLLRVARICSVAVTVMGVGLVPLFMRFDSIYDAHGAFTAAVTPPLVVTLLLSVFWRRFTRPAALATLVGGLLAIGLSLFVPDVISPLAHGVKREVPLKTTEVERGTEDDRVSRVVLDLGTKGRSHRELEVSLPGEAYRRWMVLSGSDDLREWVELGRLRVARFSMRGRQVTRKSLTYPPSDLRYLQVEIYMDVKFDRTAVKIDAVQVLGRESGMKQYKFMRACYGLCVCMLIGVGVSLCTRPPSVQRQTGLVWGTVGDALRKFKGAPGKEVAPRATRACIQATDQEGIAEGSQLPLVQVTRALAERLDLEVMDLLYIRDRRWWLGGLRSCHATLAEITDGDSQPLLLAGPQVFAAVVAPGREGQLVVVERLY